MEVAAEAVEDTEIEIVEAVGKKRRKLHFKNPLDNKKYVLFRSNKCNLYKTIDI